jgi:hypothetical protein
MVPRWCVHAIHQFIIYCVDPDLKVDSLRSKALDVSAGFAALRLKIREHRLRNTRTLRSRARLLSVKRFLPHKSFSLVYPSPFGRSRSRRSRSRVRVGLARAVVNTRDRASSYLAKSVH